MGSLAKPLLELDADAFAPRSLEERYRIYVRQGQELDLLATTDCPAGVGVAIFQLDADEREVGRRLSDRGIVGVLDGLERRWVVDPFWRETP